MESKGLGGAVLSDTYYVQKPTSKVLLYVNADILHCIPYIYIYINIS